MKKIISSKIFIFSSILLFVLGFGLLQNDSTLFETKVAEAASTDNVTGWAWSSNVGWISFNSINCDKDDNGFVDSGSCGGNNTTTTVIPYGVNIVQTGVNKGDFSGYAWSSNVGWISFNRVDTSNPPSLPYNTGTGAVAKVNTTTGVVTGWARVLSGKTSNNGWGGWIKLSGTATNGSTYGVKLDISTGKFSGYGWGSNVVGWVNFDPLTAGTVATRFTGSFNSPPVAPTVIGPATGKGFTSTPIQFKISASDPDGDNVKYLIDWDGNGTVDQTLPATGSVVSNTTITASHVWTTKGAKTFKVQAEDIKNAFSPWTTKIIAISILPVRQSSTGNNGGSGTGGGTGTGGGSGTGTGGGSGTGTGGGSGTGTGTGGGSGGAICGNNICNASAGENFVSCPADCKVKLKEF